MENARIVQQSELTTAFTRDGKILVPIDENGKLYSPLSFSSCVPPYSSMKSCIVLSGSSR